MNSTNQNIINSINRFGKTARGKRELLAYHQGGRLNPRPSILAFCYQCMGYYQDGLGDCGDPYCPLYPYMPFSSNKAKPLRKGNPETLARHKANGGG
jgi:hypothetical protein